MVGPQDKKGRENQLPLLNKNGIAWYVWTPNPIASQKEIWVQCFLCKIGHMTNIFIFLKVMCVITVIPMKNQRKINTSSVACSQGMQVMQCMTNELS